MSDEDIKKEDKAESNDVSFSPLTDEGDEAGEKDKLKELRAKLSESEKKAAEYLDGWQRARAEFINFRREQEAGLKDYRYQVRASTLLEILPILGYFERAFHQPGWNSSEPGWRSGVEQIYKELQARLKGLGVEDFGQIGEHFNPAIHESVGTRGVEKEEEDDTIIEIVEKGYRLDEKMIKPVRVIIGKYKV